MRRGLSATLLFAALGAAAADASEPAPAYGALCGDPSIRGYVIDGFDDGGGCGIREPVAVAEVAGVPLSPLAVLSCPMAERFAAWVAEEAGPAAEATLGARLAEITHVSAYTCRRRNSRPGAPLSLHATGAAIDLARFRFESGAEIDVTSGWDGADRRGAAFLRRLWRSACGPFTTVLGPESDAAHLNHFHLDIAPRARPYCR